MNANQWLKTKCAIIKKWNAIDKCLYEGKFDISKFSWNQRIRQETFDCQLRKISLLSDDLDKPLFKSHNGDYQKRVNQNH